MLLKRTSKKHQKPFNSRLKGEKNHKEEEKLNSRKKSKWHGFESMLGAMQGDTESTYHRWEFRLNFGGLIWNTESHNIPGGKQLQRASALQEASSAKLPPLLLEFTPPGSALTQQSCIILTSVNHFTSTEAQARKGISEFKPILLLDHKNPSITVSHKRPPTGTWCKTRKTKTREKKTKQGNKANKEKSLNKERKSLKSLAHPLKCC